MWPKPVIQLCSLEFYLGLVPKCWLVCFAVLSVPLFLSGAWKEGTAAQEQNGVRGAWLAQSEDHATLDLGVVSSSPMQGVEIP